MIQYIFVVPYRDREQHKSFFLRQMSYLLEDWDKDTYEILFVHQNNTQRFNRGAMKNAGFIYAKKTYPHYKEITFVFNDVDTLPYKKDLLDYNVKPGEIKHYYGFKYTLGGIFAIKGGDFEKINGFPNLFTWGWEDTVIYERALENNLTVNRDQFYHIGDMNILHLVDGNKNVSVRTFNDYKNKKITDGLNRLLKVEMVKTEMLDVYSFQCDDSLHDNTLVPFTKPLITKRRFDMF